MQKVTWVGVVVQLIMTSKKKKRLGCELLSVAQTKLNRRGTILDIGCGRGEILWAAREAGWNFVGVDPSPSHIDWAQRNLG
jgi:cyclopropane fatty-acyl-phospholipid synthase-like methyltransferase